ncbi:MAG: regulatory iron-sulfur-containing complex subunit RicT [Gemmatimonadales bacterium]
MSGQLVEVQFKGNRKAFFRWGEPEPLAPDEAVIVETDRGLDWGRVAATGAGASLKCERCVARMRAPQRSGEEGEGDTAEPSAAGPASAAPAQPERRVVRRATAADTEITEELRRTEDDVRRKVREKVATHRLQMKVSDAEWQWDRNRLTVYFTAERRVDFRNLVRDLASAFRTRIELRQIGVRDESKRLDGIGRCGRQLCCTWLPELRPIGLQIAKDQRLSLNPTQISGACGRLLCCLRYEHEFYVQSRKRFPKEGKVLVTAKGAEKVVSVDIFRERVTLRAEDATTRVVPLADLKQEVDATAPPAEQPSAPETPAQGVPRRGRRGGRRRRHGR